MGRIGGWTRLWIGATVVWTGVGCYTAFTNISFLKSIADKDYANELQLLTACRETPRERAAPSPRAPTSLDDFIARERAMEYAGGTTRPTASSQPSVADQFVRDARDACDERTQKQYRSEIEQKHRSTSKDIVLQQTMAALAGIVIPAAIVAALMWLAGWVLRGFRR